MNFVTKGLAALTIAAVALPASVLPAYAEGERFVLVTAPDARPYVRMIVERLFATLPVLSHVEIARGVEVRVIGSIS